MDLQESNVCGCLSRIEFLEVRFVARLDEDFEPRRRGTEHDWPRPQDCHVIRCHEPAENLITAVSSAKSEDSVES